MPTGSRRCTHGFTYLGLLALLALQGAALAALGRQASTAMQREREVELQFRGREIARAIERYARAAQPPRWPDRLEQLLVDERGDRPRHHLRRLYSDPFTGQPDWETVHAHEGGPVVGVRSRSMRPRMALADAEAQTDTPRVSDWQFLADPAAVTARPSNDNSQDTSGGSP